MTWRIDSSGTISGEGVETDGQKLYDRDEDLYELGNTWWFTDSGIVTISTWTTVVSTYIHMPPLVRSGDSLIVEVSIISAGTDGELRLRDVTSGNTGTEVSTGTTGKMDLTLGAWADTVRQIEIQAFKTGGTLTIGAERRMWNVWFASGG